MKGLARFVCAIAICVLANQSASATDLFAGCSLARNNDLALYTAIIVVDPPLLAFGYYVEWYETISGTDSMQDRFKEYLYWPSTQIVDSGWYQLYPLGGCDYPRIDAWFEGLEAHEQGAALCWDALETCYLRVQVVNGAFAGGEDPSGYYSCEVCVPLEATALPDWCFDGWSGDVNSTANQIEVCMDGSNKTVTASFSYCPRLCDPMTDPSCPPPPCDPLTDPNCCDPSDPNCWDQPPVIFNPENSPIVLNLSRGPYRLSGKDSPVTFDIQASGTPVRIGWTAAGADEAFLSLDRNGNGRIDDGAELFGTATRFNNGVRASNGFLALAEYDDNHDGFIDENDQMWSRLLLWRDLNHDGISQSSELTPVVGSELTAISLDYHWTGRRDSWGNIFRYEAKVWTGRNRTTETPRPVYDVFFVRVP